MNNNNHTPNYDNTNNSPMHYAFAPRSVFLLDGNKPIEITSDQLNYKAVQKAILNQDWVEVRANLDEPKSIINASHGDVSIVDNKVLYRGEELHSSVAKKLSDMINEGFTDVDRWLKFIEKLMDNPSFNSREQAYNFISHKGMPITEDGNIIGYKGVREDYMDKFSGQFDNSIGQKHEMMRSQVDDNPNNGCSSGFHIGSHEYADSWACEDGRLMLVEYSPADIVSVPDEQLHGKLRVCKYKVIDECHTRSAINNGAYNVSNDNEIEDFIVTNCNNYGSVSYHDIRDAFPSASMDDVLTICKDNLSILNPLSWNKESNDWDISLN